MLDARSFGYLGGLGGKSNFDSVLSGGVLTPEMQEGYDRGLGIRNRLNETDYSALSNYNFNVKRANYLGEEFEYNPDYDGLSTNLMYHKDYVADSDELKAAKNSLRSAGFADIPLFQPSPWAQAGVQFIKPNQFNAKNLPYTVAGAGAANVGVREDNIYGTLKNLYNEWGQYESSGFEGGNKMGGNKSNWEAMKSWNTGDRPESANSMASAYGSKEAMDKFLATGEITPDLNPTYALEAYDYAQRKTAEQQQTKSAGFFGFIKSNLGAIIGATIAGPAGAAAGAAAQGAYEGDSFFRILSSAATAYSMSKGIQSGWTQLMTNTVPSITSATGIFDTAKAVLVGGYDVGKAALTAPITSGADKLITGLGTAAGLTDATLTYLDMKEATKEAEVKAEEFGESFETVYQDAYSKDVAGSQDSIGALGSAMNPASRFTRRYGRNRFVDA